jgi:hypothetical protein
MADDRIAEIDEIDEIMSSLEGFCRLEVVGAVEEDSGFEMRFFF